MIADLKARADRLRELHHADEMLVLPNVWDAASAKIVAEAGFPVVATASAAISAMLGYPDGEGAPWQEMFAAAGRVARAVSVPVTVDAEAGYGMEPRELVDRLLEIGVVGCNLEDTGHRAGGLVDADAHAERLAAIRAAAGDAGVPIVINARADTFLPGSGYPEQERVAEAVRRGRLYMVAALTIALDRRRQVVRAQPIDGRCMPTRAVGARRPVTRGDQIPARGLWPAVLGPVPGPWLARHGPGPLAAACGCSVNRAATWCLAACGCGACAAPTWPAPTPRSWCTARTGGQPWPRRLPHHRPGGR
jgi:Phosphoenolpyruvate phosphomutase